MTNLMTRTEGIGPPTHQGVTLVGCGSSKRPQEWADAAVNPGITERRAAEHHASAPLIDD